MKQYETYSEEETEEIGRRMGLEARPGQVICLDGDLGVGKTVFSRGFARGAGVEDNISSPTFTIVKEYEDGRLPLYHFDVYRIEDEAEMEEVGYDDYFFGEGVCLIEWPERIRDILPETYMLVKIEKDPARGLDYRRITVEENKKNEDSWN